MNTAIIDRKPATSMISINFDESFAELDVTPGIILLRLDSGSDNRIDSNNRYKKEDAAGLERFRSYAEERTFLIDCMPQS